MDNSKNIFEPDLSNLVGVTHIATSVIMTTELLTDTVYFTDPIIKISELPLLNTIVIRIPDRIFSVEINVIETFFVAP